MWKTASWRLNFNCLTQFKKIPLSSWLPHFRYTQECASMRIDLCPKLTKIQRDSCMVTWQIDSCAEQKWILKAQLSIFAVKSNHSGFWFVSRGTTQLFCGCIPLFVAWNEPLCRHDIDFTWKKAAWKEAAYLWTKRIDRCRVDAYFGTSLTHVITGYRAKVSRPWKSNELSIKPTVADIKPNAEDFHVKFSLGYIPDTLNNEATALHQDIAMVILRRTKTLPTRNQKGWCFSRV